MQDMNIMILSVDKGGKTVVMNRFDYNVTKMGMFCDIRRKVEQIVDQLKDNNRQEIAQTIKDLIPQSPYAAKLYGIPKLYKTTPDRIPLCPIVSYVGTITGYPAAWIAKNLQPYVGKLQDFARNNTRSDISLYSLDVLWGTEVRSPRV